MRFHCPKCDTKYRIAEDKLAARPTAKMRCKECTTVFSVQEAIAAEARRPPEPSGRPGEGAAGDVRPSIPVADLAGSSRSASSPPGPAQPPAIPRAPLAPRPLGHARADRPASLPGASAVPLPTRPLGSPGVSRPASTAPVPAQLPRPVLGAPKAPPARTERSAGASKSSPDLPGLPGDTVSLVRPEAPLHAPVPPPGAIAPLGPGASSVGPVLGRGSARAFPPVTAERTLPAVPPLHPRAKEAEGWGSLLSLQPSSGAGEAPTEQASAPATAEAGAETAHLTPRLTGLTAEVEAASPFFAPSAPSAPFAPGSSSGPWSSNVQAPSAEVLDAETGAGAASTRPPFAAAPSDVVVADPLPIPSAVSAQGSGPSTGEVIGYPLVEPGVFPRSRPGVSRTFAGVLALVVGAAGFGSGFLVGAGRPTQDPTFAATVAQPEAQRRVDTPPPPPPPEVDEPAANGELPKAPAAEGASESNSPAAEARRRSAERRVEESASPVGNAPSSQLDSLAGLSVGAGGGPVAGSAGARGGSGAGLEAAAIQSTVQKNQNAVKRSCWQPALNGRPADAPSTARVTTTLTISPSGSVTDVKHSGDPRGYPGLGGCIAQRVKGWTFPRSTGTTTANIPFVFAAQ